MSRRYSFDSDPGESAPLDNVNHHPYVPGHDHSRPVPSSSQQHQQEPYHDFPSNSYQDPTQTSPSRTGAGQFHPGAHPDSTFNRLRHNRAQSGGSISRRPVGAGAGALAGGSAVAGGANALRDDPTFHREQGGNNWSHGAHNSITPGADNFSEAAAGGIPGLAISVADRNARESGIDAMRGTHPYQQQTPYPQTYQRPRSQHSPYDDRQGYDHDQGYDSTPNYGPSGYNTPYNHGPNASGILPPPAPSAMPYSPGATPTRSVQSHVSDPFRDPHLAYGQRLDPSLSQFNPNDIDDDGDDGLEYRRSARNSMLSLGNSSSRGGHGGGAAGAAAAGATAGGVVGGLMTRNRNSGTNYDPVQNPGTTAPHQSAAASGLGTEKPSDWIAKQNTSRRKWRWLIIVLFVLVVLGAIAGGIVGGLLNKNKGDSNGQSAADDAAKNGDLDINSAEIKALMKNPNLHKVFPGVDYTPINVQYPDCIKNPPSQNNVTRDVAVLSQLTNVIRLYGTDCNQTEMALHALQKLEKQDDIKIWLGVWQDDNDETNERQLSKMWNILDQYGDKPFKGVIVGNEVLFRQQITAQGLTTLLDGVRSNLSDHGWTLPVATSDLGDKWDPELAEISDYIMGNIHPFFAGVEATEAAAWTTTFWNNKAGTFFKKDASGEIDKERNVISEIGWPTQGGKSCGEAEACDKGSVAAIDGLNTLMEGWVCQALENGTNYFWFEMFDEPWKVSFNEPEKGKEWEDQWGLMDVNRDLKKGVKIPDCGGKTVSPNT